MTELNCTDHLHHLSDFLDEDLEPTLQATLEAHIERCANCRIVVDTLRQTVLLYTFSIISCNLLAPHRI